MLIDSITIQIPTNVKLSPEVGDLLRRLLKRKPEERITFGEFFNHPFIVGVPAEVAAEKGRQLMSLIQRAKDYESVKRMNEAFDIYCDVLKQLIPMVQSMSTTQLSLHFDCYCVTDDIHSHPFGFEQAKQICRGKCGFRRRPISVLSELKN